MWRKSRRKGRYSNTSRYSRYPSRKRRYAPAKRGRSKNIRSIVTKEVRRAVKSPKNLSETKVFYRCFMSNPPQRQKDGKLDVGARLPFWPLYLASEQSTLKQIMVPLTALVPIQRPSTSGPDSRFRGEDKVWIDWVRVQVDLYHRSTVRGLVFAFPNAERRNASANAMPYHFVGPSFKVNGGTVPNVSTEIDCYPLSTSDMDGSTQSRRQVGATDGPFAYAKNNTGDFVWNSSDGSAWNAVMSRGCGRPVGEITSRFDSGSPTSRGSVCKFILPVVGEQGNNMRYRHLDFFLRIGRWQKFKNPGNSLIDSENPLELFIFLDTPSPVLDGSMDTDTFEALGGQVSGWTVEACIRS